MQPIRPRLLLASIHDVSPRFESEVDRLIDLLERRVGNRFAMLVVPNHWHDAPIVPGSRFATRLRSWSAAGVEIFLHGFYHRDDSRHEDLARRVRGRIMTAGEGEFLGLSRTEATRRIIEGQSLLEDLTGHPVAGFVAPAWLYGEGALLALRQIGVPIAEDHFRIWSPATGARLARGPVITWASRTRPRRISSLVAAAALRRAPLEVLRIGVHPPDVHHPQLIESIEKTFAVAVQNRRAAAYSELIVRTSG
jgi:hypothetical protein